MSLWSDGKYRDSHPRDRVAELFAEYFANRRHAEKTALERENARLREEVDKMRAQGSARARRAGA